MKKFMLMLVLAIISGAVFASQSNIQVLDTAEQSAVELNVQTGDFSVAELIGVSENTLSNELAAQFTIPGIRPHFYFHTLQQCQAVPECVCQQEGALWACYIF